MTTLRQWMTLDISPCGTAPLEPVRHPERSDIEALGTLLHDAYAGTVDDEGESVEDAVREIEKTFDGVYGTPILEASYVAFDAGRPVSLSFVTDFEGAPLLTFCATAKDHQRQGLATDLILRGVDALDHLGRRRLRLIVTRANDPAVRLYHKLGFTLEADDA